MNPTWQDLSEDWEKPVLPLRQTARDLNEL
jgi:hypothetical protein